MEFGVSAWQGETVRKLTPIANPRKIFLPKKPIDPSSVFSAESNRMFRPMDFGESHLAIKTKTVANPSLTNPRFLIVAS